jgi:TonB family protein
MPEDLLNRANFGLLPEPEGRWGSFGASMVTNAVVIVLLILFTEAIRHAPTKLKYEATLVFNEATPPPPKVVVPKVKIFAPPQPKIAELQPPKIEMPKPEVQPEMPKPIHIDTPAPKLPPAPPKAVAPPPAPKVGMFTSPKPTMTANNTQPAAVKSGGFGDPLGAKPNPNSTKSEMVSVGSFNQAPGPASGAGAARKGTVQGTNFGAGVANGVPGGHDQGKVASAGFANGVVGGTGKPGGTGTIASAGFNDNVGKAPTEVALKTTTPSFVPPVVLSEPHPEYTPEAAQLRIQGEVTLQVRFLATGQVEVLKVVNGLGHGLDEQAKQVAERIRFKPAEQDGHPVDHVTLIHVTFQLA